MSWFLLTITAPIVIGLGIGLVRGPMAARRSKDHLPQDPVRVDTGTTVKDYVILGFAAAGFIAAWVGIVFLIVWLL